MITRSIQSIVSQTFENHEIIVVDDGSTDNTEEVVRELSRSASALIKYTKKENGGCASARNRGLKIATGDLFVFLDSDDTLEPTALETLVGSPS